MYIKNKKAFTLVELIVVMTILAILWTIAFISLQGYSGDANNSKILYDVKNLTSLMETRLSQWESIDNLVLNNRKAINGVNSGATILSWAYTLSWVTYEVGTFDFAKFWANGDDFVYSDSGNDRDYIFSYLKTSERLYYEFAWQKRNNDWSYSAIIKWNYIQTNSWDTPWLISENGLDTWLSNNSSISNSLY